MSYLPLGRPTETHEPFQREGGYALARRKRFGLLDEPGAGKSGQVVLAADLLQAKRGIVICPANVRENWRKEFRKFSFYSRNTLKAKTIDDLFAWQRGHFDVLMCSYEYATKYSAHILAQPFPIPFLVLDEAHYLKDPNTRRGKALLGEHSDGVGALLQWAIHAWWVTGTPVPNSPFDIYTFLRFCEVMPLNPRQFCDRYFEGRMKTFSMSYTPKDDLLPELRALIANNSLQRRVSQHLPPLFITSYYVDGDTAEVKKMLRSHPGMDAAILTAMEEGGIKSLDHDHIATLRRLIGEAKAIPYASQLVYELKQTGEGRIDKKVVFGIHRNTLHMVRDYLEREGIKTVLVDGSASEAYRRNAEDSFRDDPNTRVFIGNIKAAGVGITLTAANELDILEPEWAPMLNWQAIKRISRWTQTRVCRARLVGLAESFDEDVSDILASKTRAIAGLDGQIGDMLQAF